MDVGLQMIFASYGWSDVSDEQVWDEELNLARLAADLGFDVLWSVEHHFNDYSFCPDNLQLMSYLAAQCPDVELGTAAVILPWHDPLRVAEKVSVLDHLSRGRLRLGIGRGLARREFAAFRGTMDESRGRFDEAAPMILRALRTGVMEGDGPFYPEAIARQCMGKFVESNFYHYELLGPHFSTVKGYDAYAQKIAMAREIGMDGIVSAFMQAAVWGTPDRILRMLEERRTIVGAFELATSFHFGGTPFELAESGLRLYAKEVLPVVRSWPKPAAAPRSSSVR